jgi:hypothetical protein
VALGLALAILGLASMWAFVVDPKYTNTPENPAISMVAAPAAAGSFLI